MDRLLGYLQEDYNYIIIDCGLKHEMLTVNAFTGVVYCIVQVQAHFLVGEGIPDVDAVINVEDVATVCTLWPFKRNIVILIWSQGQSRGKSGGLRPRFFLLFQSLYLPADGLRPGALGLGPGGYDFQYLFQGENGTGKVAREFPV